MQDFYCDKCELISKYKKGEIAIEKARKCCANCKREGERIYKFDIAVRAAEAAAIPKPKGTGKKETYTRRYGTVIKKLLGENKTVREIAEIVGISPTSVVKVKKKLGC